MKFEIIKRADAHAQGRKRYYTGKPCLRGHDAQRFVSTGGCVACNAARSEEFRTKVVGRAGFFSYPLHADDFAAALAYCQALDMGRGRVPQADRGSAAVPRGAEAPAPLEHIERHRRALAEHYASQSVRPPHLPAP